MTKKKINIKKLLPSARPWKPILPQKPMKKKLKAVGNGNKINIWSNDSEEIEVVFKVELPLTELKNGFGYMGVILRNKIKDVIQCHVCGEWFKSLQTHAVKSHNLRAREYKMKFGLPLLYPLCATSVSLKKSKNAKRIFGKIMKSMAKSGSRKAWMANKQKRGLWRKYRLYSRNCAAYKNKNGICDEQLLRRYLMVADIVGKNPSEEDMDRYDPSWRGAAYNRYGGINKFRLANNLETNTPPKPIYQDAIKAALRKFYIDNGRIPMSVDFRRVGKTPSARTIYKRFGSWTRALAYAGFTVD